MRSTEALIAHGDCDARPAARSSSLVSAVPSFTDDSAAFISASFGSVWPFFLSASCVHPRACSSSGLGTLFAPRNGSTATLSASANEVDKRTAAAAAAEKKKRKTRRFYNE